MEEAYLKCQTAIEQNGSQGKRPKTVVLIGDSYAHGWLRKKWIENYHRDLTRMTKSWRSWIRLISQFNQLHPNAITDLKKLNQSRHAALNRQKSGKNADEDAFEIRFNGFHPAKAKSKELINTIQRLWERQTVHLPQSLNWYILSITTWSSFRR